MMIKTYELLKRIVLSIIMFSILFSFIVTPSTYAKLNIADGEFYYSGTTQGTYTVTESVFSWLLKTIGEIADWLVGLMTMGIRMVFVGWTALVEKLLTWALSTTTGLDLHGNLVENSTDLNLLTDSSDNVTVEAIVYNKVPALDINFFKSESERDKTISGTGKKLVCSECDRNVDECCTSSGCDSGCKCIKDKECCAACSQYVSVLNNSNVSIIQLLKDEVAKWYYIMRLLALGGMLIILIAVGIKMAISTVASEKAVYKRMLVDWLVGLIILLGVHYLMLFIITTNEIMVDTVYKFSQEINKAEMSKLNLMTLSEEAKKSDYDNNELEIKVYEEIRTRAYDPKLSIGLMGMIMYMALVFFAFKYTFIYLRRFLTIMVLTLMGPAVGVSYAYQKVFSGKSISLSNWLKEYVVNVIIQIVHGILYAVFVAQSLILSLDSLAGMLLALVCMNYITKADKLFRTVFKMDGGPGLLEKTSSAGNPETLSAPFKAIKGFVKATETKELAKTMLKTPYAKALKAVGQAAVGGAATIATAAGSAAAPVLNKVGNAVSDKVDNALVNAAINGESNTLPIRFLRKVSGKRVNDEIEDATKEMLLAKTPEEKQAAKEKRDKALHTKNAIIKSIKQPGAFKVMGQRFKRTLDVRNTFNFGSNKGESDGAVVGAFKVATEIKRGVFGSKKYDPVTGRMVADRKGIYDQLTLSNLTGLSKEDRKKLADFSKEAFAGVAGAASMIAGGLTVVANPKTGMLLLTAGGVAFNKTFGLKTPTTKSYKNRSSNYTFGRFSDGALKNIEQQRQALLKSLGMDRLNDSKKELDKSINKLNKLIEKNEKLNRSMSYKGPSRAELQKKIKAMYSSAKVNIPASAKKAVRNIKRPISRRQLQDTIKKEKITLKNHGYDLEFVNRERKEVNRVTKIGEKYEKMMKEFKEDDDEEFERLQKNYEKSLSRAEANFEELMNKQPIFEFARIEKEGEDKAKRAATAEALKEEYSRRGFEYDPITGKLKAIPGSSIDMQAGTRQAKKKRRNLGSYKSLTETGLTGLVGLGLLAGAKKIDSAIISDGSRSVDSNTSDGSKSVKNPSKSSGAVEETEQSGQTESREQTPIKLRREIERVNAELDRAIIEVSNGEKIDLSDEKAIKEIEERFEANLKKSGLISETQTVKKLFNGEMLKRNIREKTTFANNKLDTLVEELISDTDREEASRDLQAIFDEEFSAKDTAGIKVDRQDIDSRNINVRLTDEVVDRINRELQNVIESLINSGKIESMDEDSYNLIMKTLTIRLKSLGIIRDFQKADFVFKRGRIKQLLQNNPVLKRVEKAKKQSSELQAQEEKAIIAAETRVAVKEIVSTSGRIDTDNKKTIKEIKAAVTERLKETGVIKKDITEIYASEGFDDLLLSEIGRASSKKKALNKFLETALTESEAKEVKTIINGASEEEKGSIRASDVIARMVRETGTQLGDTPESKKKIAVIEQYVHSVQEEDRAVKVARDVEKRVTDDEVIDIVKERRLSTKQKIDQILNVALDEYVKKPEKDGLLEAITAATEVTNNGGGSFVDAKGEVIELSASEAVETVKTLNTAKEMIRVNRKKNVKKKKAYMSANTISLDSQINLKKQELERLKRSFGENSPQVQSLQREISQLEAEQRRSIIVDSRNIDLIGAIDVKSIMLNEENAKKRIENMNS